jgi:IclR family mhp operon transcriptional activator
MAELSQTRSLHRGLDILDALAQGPASLHELHLRTGLAKSTLRRLLATMVERRYIRRGISDGTYRSNVGIPSAAHGELTFRFGRLVEVARPHMLKLTQQVKWPSDLHVYHAGRMQILESTHGVSPFETPKSGSADTELNMFVAASGLAYLSSLNDQEVKAILDMTHDDEVWSAARFGVSPAQLAHMLADVRRRGFATRQLSQNKPQDRNAIAVPLFQQERPVAALTIAWRREHMKPDDFAALHLEALRDAAERISRAISQG